MDSAASLRPSGSPSGSPAGPPPTPQLAEIAGLVRPVSLASDQSFPVPGPLGDVLAPGGLRRGAVVAVEGGPGAGATSVAFDMAAAVTAVGEWAVFVEVVGARPAARVSTVGAAAAQAQGVAPERFAVVRVAPEQWEHAMGALLEGVSLVVAELPGRVTPSRAARLVSRARERRCVLVALGRWPQGAAVTVRVDGSTWHGCADAGHLVGRVRHVEVERRGGVSRPGVLRSVG